MGENTSSQTQFTDKYEKEGRISRVLISNFFRSLTSLLPEDTSSILETGSGPGYSAQAIRTARPSVRYTASDIDPILVEMTKKKNPGIETKIESIYELDQADGAYDLVVALEVFEHLDDPEKALAEVARVTRRYALISVPNEPIWRAANMLRGKYWRKRGNTPGHLNHWTPKAFKRFVSSRFNIISIKNPFPWTIILASKKDS